MLKGKIIKQISNDYTVKVDNDLYVCKPRGKFRKLGIIPLVGDNALIDDENNYILEIEKRKNEMIRPSIANIDQAIIVMSNKIPAFSFELLDKLINVIEYNNIKPIIYVSKLDLIEKSEKNDLLSTLKYYENIGYKVYTDLKIKEVFKDKVSVLVGQTGAGKSTLLNKLDLKLELLTGEVSNALGRGKHTTRHTELIETLSGLIADTPGFSKISFIGMNKEDIRDNFVEFDKHKQLCEYKDCMHYNEENCEIKKQVILNNILPSRYNNYLKFLKER